MGLSSAFGLKWRNQIVLLWISMAEVAGQAGFQVSARDEAIREGGKGKGWLHGNRFPWVWHGKNSSVEVIIAANSGKSSVGGIHGGERD
jgi:hypothetical protein